MIKKSAIAITNDEEYEKFFEKIYKVIKVLLFLTVGQKKIDASKKKLEKLNLEVTECNMNNSEMNGKINLLKKILDKLNLEKAKQPIVNENKVSPSDIIDKEVLFHLNFSVSCISQRFKRLKELYSNELQFLLTADWRKFD